MAAAEPWKLLPNGVSPAPGQDLNPYGIWIAEVMPADPVGRGASLLDALVGDVPPGRDSGCGVSYWCGCNGKGLAITREPAGC